MDIEQFKTDYNNNITQIELMGKYNLTDYMYKLILKNYQLSRKKSCKSLRLFNIKPNIYKSFIPIDEIYKVDKQIPTNEFYSNIKTNQEDPKDILPNEPKPKRNIKTKVVKIKENTENSIKKPIKENTEKVVKKSNKKQEPIKDENKNKLPDDVRKRALYILNKSNKTLSDPNIMD